MQVYAFEPPERFVAGTVGRARERTFFLQARGSGRLVSVVLEKVQVSLLADKLDELLAEAHRRFGVDVPAEPETPDDNEPLELPLDEEFRVGTLGLAWDGDTGTVVIEAIAVGEYRGRRSRGGGAGRPRPAARAPDPGGDPGLHRPGQAAGRRRPAPCPLCGQPLDPAGHLCPATTATGGSFRMRPEDAGAAAVPTQELRCSPTARSSSRAAWSTRPTSTLRGDHRAGRGERALRLQAGPRRAPRWTSPTAPWPAARWPRTSSPRRPGGCVPPTVLPRRAAGAGRLPALGRRADDAVPLLGFVPRTRCRRTGSRWPRPGTRTTARTCWPTPTTSALARMALFDAVVNNADRKGGHVLPTADGECTASTMASASTSRTSCARCSGAGWTSRYPPRWSNSWSGCGWHSTPRWRRRWPRMSRQPRSPRCGYG